MTEFKPADINAAPICEKQKKQNKTKMGKLKYWGRALALSTSHLKSEMMTVATYSPKQC